MRAITASRWLALGTCLLLSACGGGGGGGGGGSTPSLSLSPGSIAVNTPYQSIATASVQATIQNGDAITSTVYVDIEDSQQVLTGSVDIAEIDRTRFSATLHTSPSLAMGHHTGSFRVYLCKDVNCTSTWAAPVSLPYDINVTPQPLAATAASVTSVSAHQGADAAGPLLIDVQGMGLNWSASSNVSWLQVDTTVHADIARLSASYATASLAQGNYSGEVTITSTDGQKVGVLVQLAVLPTAFTLTGGVPSFTAVNGAPIDAQTLSFALDSGVSEPWTLSSSAPWMAVGALSGTTPASVTLQPHPEWSALASGDYDDTLTLASPGLATSALDAHLSLVKPTLSTPATLTFGGTLGRDMFSIQTPVGLNTGANTFALTATAPSWMSVDTSAKIGGAGGTVPFTPVPSQATPGSMSGTVMLSAHVNGDTVTAPVTVNFNLDQQRLLPSAWAVAFASTPTGTVTTRTLSISPNFGAAVAWTAVSDAAWLTVTAAGVTGGAGLVLSANPAQVPMGASTATVHVAPTTSGATPADIRVGFWKDATGLSATTSLPVNQQGLAADKILPYVYSVNDGTDIEVYNAYTATHVATIANVGSVLTNLSVSADGRRLFALDGASNSVQVVDLVTRTKTDSWHGVNLDQAPAWAMMAIRPAGFDIVVLDNGVLLADGRTLPAIRDGYDTPRLQAMAVTEDQRTMVAYDYTLAGYFKRLELDFTVIAGGQFIARENGANGTGYTASPVAFDPDGHVVYTAGQSRCWILDGHTMQQTGSLPGGALTTNNIVVTSDHRAVCGSGGWYNDPSLTTDLWVHSAAGVQQQSYKIAGSGHSLRGASLVATPDGFVLAVLTDDPKLAFIPIGAP